MARSRSGSKAWEWFKFIAIRILFPPIILWDFLKFLIGCLVLPPLWFFAKKDPTYFNNEFFVETEDGVKLNTTIALREHGILSPLKQEEAPYAGEKYVVYFLGNAEYYQYILKNHNAYYGRFIDNTKTVLFNYRGVYGSTGRANEAGDLVNDGIAQVKYLLDRGVAPKDITLYGYSLGGAVATLVASHFHKEGKPIYLFNDRSFSSITNVVVGWLQTLGSDTIHVETTLGKFLGFIFTPFIKLILKTSGWEMDVSDSFKGIPETHKKYVVVRTSTKREKPPIAAQDDGIISYSASLHSAVKLKQKVAKNCKFELDCSHHEDHEKNEPCKENAHFATLEELMNSKGTTAFQFFKEFVERDAESVSQQSSLRH